MKNANVTIIVKGEQTGEVLAKVFGADEYKTVGYEWQAQFDAANNAQEIDVLVSLVNEYDVAVGVEIEVDGESVSGEIVTLAAYEKAGGVYSDAGNGGEDVNKEDFDLALNILIGTWSSDWNVYVKALFGERGFWEDTVTSGLMTNFYLRHKN